MNRGFSLVELIIVVAVLGILAAIALPTFQGHATTAKSAAAKENLRVLRSAIELYAAEHNSVPPGYPYGDTSIPPHFGIFMMQLVEATNVQGLLAEPGTPGYDFGPYISKMPENPFNGRWILQTLHKTETLPEEATGAYGYIYKAATKEIRLDWPGTDNDGVRYYDY